MRTVDVYLDITPKDGKKYRSMVRETGRSIHDCLEKAKLGWEEGDKAEIRTWIAI